MTQSLGRKGRPPAVHRLGDTNQYAIAVKGEAMRFLRTSTGWFKLLTTLKSLVDNDITYEDVEYARRVLARAVNEEMQ